MITIGSDGKVFLSWKNFILSGRFHVSRQATNTEDLAGVSGPQVI